MAIQLDVALIKDSEDRMKNAMAYMEEADLKGVAKHGALLELFRESAEAKTEAVACYVRELLTEGDRKFIVFAHHHVMMDNVARVCEEQKVQLVARYVDSIGVLTCQCLWTTVSPVLSDSGY